MTRYALCLIGQPRTAEYCASSLQAHIIAPYNPDIFIVSDSQSDLLRELYHPVAAAIYDQDYIWRDIGDRRTRYIKHSPETIPENDLSVMWKARFIQESPILNYSPVAVAQPGMYSATK